MKRILAFLIVACACRAAEVQFIGVMASAKETLFAVRESESAKTRWVSLGDQIAGYVVSSYDGKADALTLQSADRRLVLRLPESRVQMARDEVVQGLASILTVIGATRMSDLLHPKLRPLFSEADLNSGVFSDVLSPATKIEIREIPKEFTRGLEDSLAQVEKIVGVRPTHGLWIKARGLSMSFVVKVGEGWFLAPSVPKEKQ